VNIIDGTGNSPIPSGRVVISGERIVAVGPSSIVEIPPNADIITCDGYTALPGLIDVHVHVPTDGNMSLYVKNGITSIRFAGGFQKMLMELRGRIERHEIPGPRIFSVGPGVDATPHSWPGSMPADSPIEARRVVRRLVEEEQVDAILATHAITKPILNAIVQTAHELGVSVTGQLWASDARDAIASRMDGLENTSLIPESDAYPRSRIRSHLSVSRRIALLAKIWSEVDWEATTEVAHLMAEQGMFLAPELVSFEAWAGLCDTELKCDRDWVEYGPMGLAEGFEKHNSYISEDWGREEILLMGKAVESYKRFCSVFYSAGGLLVTGTDLSFGGIFLHREMGHFLEVGLTPLEVIRSATRQAASVLGREDIGCLAPGWVADLIVVKGDPTVDLAVLRDVRYTFVGGHPVVFDGIVQRPFSC
jgi:hypothetical protein